MKLTIREIDYHRNGVAGEGFNVITFLDHELKRDMVAILFSGRGQCAVFDRKLLGEGVIEFGRNSWRGDTFETFLRDVVKLKEVKEMEEEKARTNERIREYISKTWI